MKDIMLYFWFLILLLGYLLGTVLPFMYRDLFYIGC